MLVGSRRIARKTRAGQREAVETDLREVVPVVMRGRFVMRMRHMVVMIVVVVFIDRMARRVCAVVMLMSGTLEGLVRMTMSVTVRTKMMVAESERELERQRKKRQQHTPVLPRSQPAHVQRPNTSGMTPCHVECYIITSGVSGGVNRTVRVKPGHDGDDGPGMSGAVSAVVAPKADAKALSLLAPHHGAIIVPSPKAKIHNVKQPGESCPCGLASVVSCRIRGSALETPLPIQRDDLNIILFKEKVKT